MFSWVKKRFPRKLKADLTVFSLRGEPSVAPSSPTTLTTLSPKKFPTSGFELIDGPLFEEESFGLDLYYPVRIGEAF